MPPKKKGNEPSAKTINKMKEKIVDDKTFGLKNKNKSKVVQQYVKQVEQRVMTAGQGKGGQRAQEEKAYKEAEEKKKQAAQKALLASLFKSVVTIQTNADGEIDKKATLCGYFKAGVCEKGKKCKYSHDLTLEDNREMKIDLYSDPRAKSGKAPDTIITCRSFIESVEKELYGFKWLCPNGGDACQYLHRLPQGFILDRDKGVKSEGESDEEMTLEERIEEERAQLKTDDLTPVTLETFTKWKADRAIRKEKELEQRILAEEAKGRKDRSQMAFMSGRALFNFNPDLFVDDDGAVADDDFNDFDDNANGDEEEKKGSDDEGDEGPLYGNDNDQEESKEESKQNVEVDRDLFAGEAGAVDEDIDFD